jgi:hypothetical protein
MGKVRMMDCKSMIEKGAKFDRIALADTEARKKVVQEKTWFPWTRTEWNFRQKLMTKK